MTTKNLLDPAATLLAAGVTYREAADLLGIPDRTLGRRYPGLSDRSRPGRRGRRDITDQMVLDLQAEGLSHREIAVSLDASTCLVRGRLAKYGLASDPHADRK